MGKAHGQAVHVISLKVIALSPAALMEWSLWHRRMLRFGSFYASLNAWQAISPALLAGLFVTLLLYARARTLPRPLLLKCSPHILLLGCLGALTGTGQVQLSCVCVILTLCWEDYAHFILAGPVGCKELGRSSPCRLPPSSSLSSSTSRAGLP